MLLPPYSCGDQASGDPGEKNTVNSKTSDYWNNNYVTFIC